MGGGWLTLLNNGNTTFYLAHPFPSRKRIREWEIRVEREIAIALINPFYDVKGKEYIEVMDRRGVTDRQSANVSGIKVDTPHEIVERDLAAIRESDGVLAIITKDVTLGTPMEIFYAASEGKTVFTICEVPELLTHPWLRFCSSVIFKSLEEGAIGLRELVGWATT